MMPVPACTSARSAVAPSAGSGLRSRLRQAHLRIGLIGLLALLPASGVFAALDIQAQLALVALPIGLLGVMHGALDPWVGDVVLRRQLGRPRRLVFFACYLVTMAAVIACWLAAPLYTLVAFLLISVVHFGEQDAFAFAGRSDGLTIAVFGAVPVLGPVAAHPTEVARIFAWLTGIATDTLAEILGWVAQPLIALWIVGAGMLVSRAILLREHAVGFQVIGLAVMVVSMMLLPPLIAFASYFCLLHSFGHLLDMAARESGPWRDWTPQQWAARLWPATLGALALGLLGWIMLSGFETDEMIYRKALAQAIFCGLAALTIPHVLLHGMFKAGSKG